MGKYNPFQNCFCWWKCNSIGEIEFASYHFIVRGYTEGNRWAAIVIPVIDFETTIAELKVAPSSFSPFPIDFFPTNNLQSLASPQKNNSLGIIVHISLEHLCLGHFDNNSVIVVGLFLGKSS